MQAVFPSSSGALSLPSAPAKPGRWCQGRWGRAGHWLKWNEPSRRALSQAQERTCGEVREGLQTSGKVKPSLFSSHGNLSHFHPVDVYFQLPLASPVPHRPSTWCRQHQGLEFTDSGGVGHGLAPTALAIWALPSRRVRHGGRMALPLLGEVWPASWGHHQFGDRRWCPLLNSTPFPLEGDHGTKPRRGLKV